MPEYKSLHQFYRNGKIGYRAQNENLGLSGPDILSTYTTESVSSFRLWIPPGTTAVNLSLHVSQSNGVVPYRFSFVARIGQAPAIPTDEDFYSLPAAGFTLAQLTSGDCLGRSSGGYLRIVKDSGLNVSSGAWIYVQMLSSEAAVIDTNSTVSVDLSAFSAWYSLVSWLADGDPPGNPPDPENLGALTVTPAALSFGYVEVFGSSTLGFTIKNNSDTNIDISSIELPTGFSFVD